MEEVRYGEEEEEEEEEEDENENGNDDDAGHCMAAFYGKRRMRGGARGGALIGADQRDITKGTSPAEGTKDCTVDCMS